MGDLRFRRKYFELVASGRKKLEARVNYPSIRKIKVGETVRFFWENRHILVRIIDIRFYPDFSKMIKSEDVELLMPGTSRIEALAEYKAIYPEWKLRKFGGVRVFSFEKI